MLFEFPHESARLKALHFHEETKQVKIRLPLTFSKLPKQHLFQIIKRLIRIIADIPCVQNVPKAMALAYLSFCDLIPAAGELGLNEADPDMWFSS
jgi:hypothetical protein